MRFRKLFSFNPFFLLINWFQSNSTSYSNIQWFAFKMVQNHWPGSIPTIQLALILSTIVMMKCFFEFRIGFNIWHNKMAVCLYFSNVNKRLLRRIGLFRSCAHVPDEKYGFLQQNYNSWLFKFYFLKRFILIWPKNFFFP